MPKSAAGRAARVAKATTKVFGPAITPALV